MRRIIILSALGLGLVSFVSIPASAQGSEKAKSRRAQAKTKGKTIRKGKAADRRKSAEKPSNIGKAKSGEEMQPKGPGPEAAQKRIEARRKVTARDPQTLKQIREVRDRELSIDKRKAALKKVKEQRQKLTPEERKTKAKERRLRIAEKRATRKAEIVHRLKKARKDQDQPNQDAKKGKDSTAKIPKQVSKEMARHARYLAMVHRIQELAIEKENEELTKRADALLEKEEKRHSMRLAKLLNEDAGAEEDDKDGDGLPDQEAGNKKEGEKS